MALSVFDNKKVIPGDKDVANVLEHSGMVWDKLKKYVYEACGDVSEEWKHYSKASGWTLLLKHGKRTILYLYPSKAFFTVLFVYGEKAVERALNSKLPQDTVDRILEAKPYMEGRSFQVEVRSIEDLAVIKELIGIKLES